ncbi:hypothetical protein V6N12_058289 [Hibiscus sabdariffa]|uniref:Uncharacterized protein n=1 Tax=Hibiscus sabdariffa TaxID=183260 RepID=A0ABR2EVS6_9ROSI
MSSMVAEAMSFEVVEAMSSMVAEAMSFEVVEAMLSVIAEAMLFAVAEVVIAEAMVLITTEAYNNCSSGNASCMSVPVVSFFPFSSHDK